MAITHILVQAQGTGAIPASPEDLSVETFTSTNGTAPNSDYWQDFTLNTAISTTRTIQNDEFNPTINIPTTTGGGIEGGGIESKFLLQGDFDVSVKLPSYVTGTSTHPFAFLTVGENLGIGIGKQNGSFFVGRFNAAATNSIYTYPSIHSSAGFTTGLRVTRVSTVETVYYEDVNSGTWNPLGTGTNNGNDSRIRLYASIVNSNATGTSEAFFDDLTITTGTFVWL